MSSNEVEVAEEAPPTDELRESLVSRLTELVGDAVLEHHIVVGKDVWIRVKNEAWVEVGNAVRVPMGARFFGFVSAIDWMPSPYGRSMDSAVDTIVKGATDKPVPEMVTGYAGGESRFQVIARVTNLKAGWSLNLKTDVGDAEPSVASWTQVYAGADWHEREVFEMFGINFVGHPGLRKIYLPGDFEGNPMRKDFPLLARMVKPWPGIVDTEPMPGANEPADAASSEEAVS